MALKLNERYPSRTSDPSLDYPTGAFRNKTSPTSTDGTPLEKDWANDWFGARDALLAEAEIVANGDIETAQSSQVLQALVQLVKNTSPGDVVRYEDVTFGPSVADGDAVYWNTANSRYDQAIADGTDKQKMVGFADVTNSLVEAFGRSALFSGLTAGSKYYLSGSTAGAITATAPSEKVSVGLAKSATVMFVDIDATVDAAQNIAVFTTAGTSSWTVPDILKNGTLKAKVTVTGGGGAGSSGDGKAGGGSGGTAIKYVDLTGVESVTITVGAGSIGVIGGGAVASGGASSFGIFLSATGGARASVGTLSVGGSAGVGVGGDFNLRGSDGTDYDGFGDSGQDGGSSFWGGGARGGTNGGENGAQGGGGGGASSGKAGNGGNGLIVVEW